MAEIPICFYIAPSARPAQQWAAIELSHDLGMKSRRRWLTHPFLHIPDEVETAVVVGGDGSLRAVAETMARRNKPGVVLAMRGGSQNGFWGSLERNGSTVDVDHLADVKPNDLQPFNPLLVNGHISLNLVALEDAALTFSELDESFRGTPIPRGLRMPTAGVIAALKHTGREPASQNPLLRAFVTASDYRGREVFPGQEMFGSNKFTQVTVSQMARQEALVFCLKTIKGIIKPGPFPRDLLQLEQHTKVIIPHKEPRINVGGDPLELGPHEELTITRDAEHQIYVAALKFPQKRRTRVK